MGSADFLDLVTRHSLAEAGSLWQFLADQGGAKGLPPEATELAGRLVENGLLTRFQADRVLGGEPDTLLVGPFHLLDSLGGEAYLARRQRGNSLAVLKPAPNGVPPTIPGHPNLIQGQPLDGTGWMLMEVAPGKPLSTVPPMAPVPAARVVAAVASALAHLHAAGLVHGRIRAEHVLLGPDGEARLLPPSRKPAGTQGNDLFRLAHLFRDALDSHPPALEGLIEGMKEGTISAHDVADLLADWLLEVSPPPLIVPNRRSSVSGILRPEPEPEPEPESADEPTLSWAGWALMAVATIALGLAALGCGLLR